MMRTEFEKGDLVCNYDGELFIFLGVTKMTWFGILMKLESNFKKIRTIKYKSISLESTYTLTSKGEFK